MPPLTRVTWNPNPLNAAILRAFPPSARYTAADALANRPTSKAGVRLRLVSPVRATLIPTGLGFVFEGGRQGGYPIFPGGVVGARRSRARTAIKDEFGRGTKVRAGKGTKQGIAFNSTGGKNNTGVRRSTIGGDMAPRKYVAPAGFRWAQGGFQREAIKSLARSGFARRAA